MIDAEYTIVRGPDPRAVKRASRERWWILALIAVLAITGAKASLEDAAAVAQSDAPAQQTQLGAQGR